MSRGAQCARPSRRGAYFGGALLALVLAYGVVRAVWNHFWPPLPPLLRGADTERVVGWPTACPAESEADRSEQTKQLSVSPELERRIRERVRLGASETVLRDLLTSQGFAIRGSCETDASVHRAEYFKDSRLPFSDLTHAYVFWKVDGSGRVVWIHAMIFEEE